MGDQFLIDNSPGRGSVREVLSSWLPEAASLDVATGYFEIGALVELEEHLQSIGSIRILIGGETSRQTSIAIREASEVMDVSIGSERQRDPFLTGLPTIVDAMRSGRIEVRVYAKKKFHAKAYLAGDSEGGGRSLVGSSNLTRPGLSRNIELNVSLEPDRFLELKAWYEGHWAEAIPATEELLTVIEHHLREYTPFEVYAKALQTLTADVDPTELEWERNDSKIYPLLAPYQQEGYRGIRQRAEKHGGAFLTDGVGLGKTFVGMMLAEYYAERRKLNVLIMATKTGEDAVWKPAIARYMPELIGEFTRIKIMAHTDLSKQDAMQTVRRLRDRVDVVIIDEGHNFRNRGSVGEDPDNPRSRWRRMQMLCEGKTVIHLTATPINNRLFDLVHEFELFTGLTGGGERGDRHFEQTLGIASVHGYVRNIERTFLDELAAQEKSGESIENMTMADFEKLLQQDRLLGDLIVQHSRQYAKRSAEASGLDNVLFPEPSLPRAVPYDYDAASRRLLEDLESAFEKANPLFTLPMYYPLAFSKREGVDVFLENRQKQVVGLIRTVFLKRFESSIASFTGSCIDLSTKIQDWIHANSGDMPEIRQRLESWKSVHERAYTAALAAYRPEKAAEADALTDSEDDDNDAELLSEIALDVVADEFDLDRMFDAAFEDLHQLGLFVERAVTVSQTADVKFDRLAVLLGVKKDKTADPLIFDPAFRSRKVLIFTEFADTARYLHQRLVEAGLQDVDRLDGERKGSRLEMIRRFAPFYNHVPDEQRIAQKPLRVLVSTDVLSEGVNLQDGTLVVNYDIHWNPVRLMQRIGRIDRRMDPDVEKKLVQADPSAAAMRGTTGVRNFLAPAELERLLSLAKRVTHRTLLISKTLGIPGGRLLTEADMLDDVKVFASFLEDYYGDVSPAEQLRLKYLSMLVDNPTLKARLEAMPPGVYAARGGSPAGTFVCAIDPGPEQDDEGKVVRWRVADGQPRWSFLTTDGVVVDSLPDIDRAIACEPIETGVRINDRAAALQRLGQITDAQKQRMHKELQLPLDAETSQIVCWMEVL